MRQSKHGTALWIITKSIHTNTPHKIPILRLFSHFQDSIIKNRWKTEGCNLLGSHSRLVITMAISETRVLHEPTSGSQMTHGRRCLFPLIFHLLRPASSFNYKRIFSFAFPPFLTVLAFIFILFVSVLNGTFWVWVALLLFLFLLQTLWEFRSDWGRRHIFTECRWVGLLLFFIIWTKKLT